MATSKLIPTGRTSLVKKGGLALQLQTEYGYYPYPRITTTVSNSGQVVHKIERKLEQMVESLDEQAQVEEAMKQQHSEVSDLISEQAVIPLPVEAPEAREEDSPAVEQELAVEESSVDEEAPVSEEPAAMLGLPSEEVPEVDPLVLRLREVPGMEHIYTLDNDGNFLGELGEKRFRKTFPTIYKGLRDLIEVFPRLTKNRERRELGVYEAERGRLYFVSKGYNCYFVSARRISADTDYEAEVNDAFFGA